MHLATKLQQNQRRLGWKTIHLAAAVGVRESTAWRWLHGETVPAAQHLVGIAGAYGVSLDELCRGVRW